MTATGGSTQYLAPGSTERPTPPPRTWRPMALWAAGILLALGLAWFAGAVLRPVLQVRRAVLDCKRRAGDPLSTLGDDESVIADLGGREAACSKLSLYIRLPVKPAPHKVFALRLLGQCGRRGAAELARVLRTDNPALQRVAASALYDCGPEAAEAVPELLQLVHKGGELPAAAPGTEEADDIADIGEAELLPVGPPHPSRPADLLAFMALSRIGRKAIPALASLADSAEFRAPAAYLLSKQGEEAVPWLEQWLRAPHEEARALALDSLADIGSLQEAAAAKLLATDPDDEVRRAALRLLARHTPSLLLALSDKAPDVRADAAVRLLKIDRLGIDALPPLTAALRDDHPIVRAAAAGCMGKIGPPAADAVDDLLALLTVRDRGLVPPLCLLRRTDRQPLSEHWGHCLSRAYPRVRGVAHNRALGGEGPSNVRLATLEALGRIGAAAARAIPTIEPLLRDEDAEIRAAAARALEQLRAGEAAR